MREPALEQETVAEDGFGTFGRLLLGASKVLAIIGGLTLVLLVLMSIVSIVGRKLWAAPVPGDVEMLQLCGAAAASSFFALCHLSQGDVKVDFFTNGCRPAIRHGLDALGSALLGVMAALITWRLIVGALSVREYRETSMVLAWPTWIPQMLMAPGFALLTLAAAYTFTRALAKARTEGRA